MTGAVHDAKMGVLARRVPCVMLTDIAPLRYPRYHAADDTPGQARLPAPRSGRGRHRRGNRLHRAHVLTTRSEKRFNHHGE
jgi:hypothetical protein